MKPISPIAVLLLACATLLLAAPPASADNNEAAYKAALEGYIRFLPRYYAVNVKDRYTSVKQPNWLPQAPLNQLGYRNEPTDHRVNQIVRANVDTVLAAGFIDVSETPAILRVPAVKKRYWRVQLCDLWTEVTETELSSLHDAKPGDYAIVGPNFTGDIAGVQGIIRANEGLNYLTIRVGYERMRMEGPNGGDVSKALKTLRAFTLGNVNQRPPAKAKKSAKSRMQDRSLRATTTELAKNEPLRLLDELRDAVKRPGTPLTPDDERVLAALESHLDVAMDNTASLDAQRRASAMIEAVAAARRQIDNRMRRAKEGRNGWVSLLAGDWNDRYLDRAACAEYALFADHHKQVMHIEIHVDQHGEALQGNRRYQITFPKGSLPPADAFWSITSYRDDTLAPGKNAIERGSIGNLAYRLKQKKGQTLIFVQHVRPDEGKIVSWLPAPSGQFNLVLRAYGPSGELLDDVYKMPVITRNRVSTDDPTKAGVVRD